MASVSSRNASLADRRSTNYNAARPRTAMSTRTGDYERPFVREDGSPVPFENHLSPRDNEKTPRRFSRGRSASGSVYERRTERMQLTAKESVVRRRSPVKESPPVGDRKGSAESVVRRRSPIKGVTSPGVRTPSASSRRDSAKSKRFLDTLFRQNQKDGKQGILVFAFHTLGNYANAVVRAMVTVSVLDTPLVRSSCLSCVEASFSKSRSRLSTAEAVRRDETTRARIRSSE